jgi:uncharacterized protein YbaR (Trm112 family)/SAM-dependent methyltransferase
MKKSLLEILACPRCRLDLVLRQATTVKEEIVAGRLECFQCSASYAIRDGVPCMLAHSERANHTQQGFSEQWRLRQTGELNRARSYGQDAHTRAGFLSEIELLPQQPDLWLLDAGCGSGDLTYAVAAQNPQVRVVGLDFSDTIYPSAEQAPDYPNLDFVHGDIMRPPFIKSAFYGLYSWGALHHTEDTRVAFRTTASLVARDGSMAVWIYPHPSESLRIIKALYLFRDLLFFGRGHLIPGRLRFRLAQVASVLCSPAFAVAFGLDGLSMGSRLGRQRLREIRESFKTLDWRAKDFYQLMTFLVYDSITPEHQFRHRRAEVLRWFKEGDFGDVQTHDAIPGYYWAKRLDGRTP